jgi:predicted GTPase
MYGNYEFKCKEAHHGSAFERYNQTVLLQLLNALEPCNKLNILILGETGVGKSTLVNAFVNYLSFESLDDAMNNETLNCVASCSLGRNL